MDYVTADLHFGHAALLKFPERQRFKTIKEHDEFIIRSLNSKLSPDDTLYVLGDVGFRDADGSLCGLAAKIKRIECKRKILVMGNHDHFSAIEAKTVLGFDEVHSGPIYYEHPAVVGRIILSHEPVREAFDNPYVINVHGHIHNYKLDLEGFHNANIGMTGFTPLSMDRFVALAKKCKSRSERFGKEWFYGAYVFPEGGSE